jgi:hypothetical protein
MPEERTKFDNTAIDSIHSLYIQYLSSLKSAEDRLLPERHQIEQSLENYEANITNIYQSLNAGEGGILKLKLINLILG